MRRRSTGTAAAPRKTRALGYIRVSTIKQTEEGQSLEAQEEKLRAYATLHELELVRVVVDAGESASSLDRPGLQEVLGQLKAGAADALVVVKLDRLTRSVRDLGELVEGHFGEGRAALMSVSESIDTRSAAGRLVLNVLASVSQWEREAIGERTSAVMQHKISKGEYTGGRPRFGYRVTDAGALEPVPEEQRLLTAARKARKAGLSIRATSARLAERGFLNRNGKPFGPAEMWKLLAP